jgi:hypothetical protein
MTDQEKPHLIKTPIHKIPIGEAIKAPDGRYTLRIKKPKGAEVEEIPLEKLISMVISEADRPSN